MTYPALTKDAARRVRDCLKAAIESNEPDVRQRTYGNLEEHVHERGSCDVTAATLYDQSEALRVELIDNGGAARRAAGAIKPHAGNATLSLEELMAERLHRDLNALPAEALYDSSFWRYLALFPFRWFLIEREPHLKDVSFGAEDSGRRSWLLPRTFVWGMKCHQRQLSNPYSNVYAIKDLRRQHGESDGYVIDFYHSHVIRTRWSDDPKVVNAFIQTCSLPAPLIDVDDNGPVRALANQTKRLATNLCLPFLDDQELISVLRKQR